MLTKRTFQEIFSSLHTPCLVFLPDSPRFTIVEVNEAFTNAVKVQRSELINRGLFKAFQDSENPEWTGHDLLASIKYVLKEKEPHDMDMQKFYVSANNGNGSELKYWNPVNSPVFNEDGEISVIVHSVSDVTDMVRLKESEAREKATEQTLEETNNRLSTILASITDGFFAVDSSWIVTYWNTEAEKLLKIKSEEILGRDLWKVFSPHTDQSLMKFYQEYKNVMDNRKPASFRGYYEEMDVWFKVNVYPGKDGLSVFFTDITRQKKVERERGQALQRLHERGKEQACLYRITNLKEQDYTVPELLLEVVHYIPGGWRSPEFTSAKIDFNGQSFETDHFEPSDWTITSVNRTRNGPLRISVSYTNELPGIEENPVRDEDIRLLDSITHNLCLKIDQILGQQELEENRAELQKIMDQSMDVICTIDHQSRFVKVGAVSEKVWGYHPAELVGSSYLDLVYGDDISQTIQSVNSLLSGSKVITFENRCIRKDGAVRSMEWSARNDHENEIMYCVARDVTAKKEAASEREKLIKELTQNNNDLRQFSYITSHNLRSPISNLTNLAYLLEKIPIENNNLKEILDDSRTSIRVLNETIDDLTEILIIRDNPSVEQEKIAFSDIFENILQQTSYLIEKEKPRIVSNFEDAPSIFYNRVYLESIFLNLLTNALKFRSPSRRPEITITTIDRKDHVLLEFQDNGIGLDIRRYKDRIFGLYQRFHQHTDSKGLGLYLVKSQVEALGGSIEAKSKAGQGMTILIRFKKE